MSNLLYDMIFGKKLDFATANHIRQYINLLWTRNTYLKLKLLKRKIPFKVLYPCKGTKKVKDLQKSLIKKFTSPFDLIVLNNTKNLSNSFHGQTSLKDTIFSVKKALMNIYFLSGIKLLIFLFP